MTVNGLVLKEVKLREADKILTLLTPGGIISVSARGSMRPKNKLFSASGLFCYSEWTLFNGRTMYRADEATPVELFYGLRNSIESVSLAAYIAELLCLLSPTGEEAARLLRLALNCFFLLSEDERPAGTVKAAFELRSLAEAGFMPDLEACAACGEEEDIRFFDRRTGSLLCGACMQEAQLEPNITAGTLAAMRQITAAELPRLFAFSLKGESEAVLRHMAEEYMLFHLDYPPKTLAFLRSVLDGA